jgi:hypothetical protein
MARVTIPGGNAESHPMAGQLGPRFEDEPERVRADKDLRAFFRNGRRRNLEAKEKDREMNIATVNVFNRCQCILRRRCEYRDHFVIDTAVH